ncbi:hypothetical protein [Streptomyces cellostaticus]|uniref:hypothetical protein n=1 Tax=Streptomyces cellostaticus TaxID=67285 RepID=UPI00202651EC|nr:hypothetical protein [Streptomyces cellostaticus]
MAKEPENTTPIQSVWAQRCAGDLVVNREKQAGLRQQLEELQREEEWLVKWQASLSLPVAAGGAAGGDAAGGASGAASEASAVPSPRQEDHGEAAQSGSAARKRTAGNATPPVERTAAEKVTRKKATGKKPARKGTAATEQTGQRKTAPARKATARKAAARATGSSAPEAGKPKQPALRQLVLDVLSRTPGEPRLAREVHDALAKEHPDRATSVQSVRNTLEKLVRSSAAVRTDQQGSVMYTAQGDGAHFAADGEAAQAGGRVPAQV